MWLVFCVYVFFFQAEDGIRDVAVTGVQTCALPICFPIFLPSSRSKFWQPWSIPNFSNSCGSIRSWDFLRTPTMAATATRRDAMPLGSRTAWFWVLPFVITMSNFELNKTHLPFCSKDHGGFRN